MLDACRQREGVLIKLKPYGDKSIDYFIEIKGWGAI